MKKLFGELKMTWLSTVLFALAAGVYTGIVMLVPIFNDTSFQDIGVSFEWWVLFAVIVVVNCDKSWDAMLKCFVFFLISQPVVYAVQIIAGTLSFDMAWGYYFHGTWFKMTFLTLPGGFIAYYSKKQNALGAIILGLGNTIVAAMGYYYAKMAIKNFPHHILTVLFCIAAVIIMSINVQKEKKNRIIAILIPAAAVLAVLLFETLSGSTVL